ncbi:MAG: dTDP-4-dehydrorhamnose reductase [Candidatus Marinimicrobia bacterium]|nr:dTDP-4-dehydrorhamnose reductase [Candidatus Neomarinimicrobiota bacterium]
MKAKNVLITGGNGLLGYHLTRVYGNETRNILSTDIHDHILSPGVSYSPLNICDKNAVFTLCNEFNPSLILNAAAFTNVDDCETSIDTAFAVNTFGPRYLAEWCALNPCKLIHFSTDYLFNGEAGPYSETACPDPINIYGLSKLGGESQIRRILKNHLIIRTNVLFGKGPTEKASFVRWVVESLRNHKLIHVVDDQYNNPTWSNDLARAVKKLDQLELTGVIHYGGPDYVNRYEFACLVSDIFDLDKTLIHPISTNRLALAAPRPLKGGLDIRQVQTFPDVPLTPLKTILKRIKETGY